MAASLVDDMDDFYSTPPAVLSSVPRSPEEAPNEVPGFSELAAPATSFNLLGLKTVIGGSNERVDDTEGVRKDADTGGPHSVPNEALGTEPKDATIAGGIGVSLGAFEDDGDSQRLTKPLGNVGGGVSSTDGLSVGDAQNSSGRADSDQTEQVQAPPSETVTMSTTNIKSNDQMDWEQAADVQAEIQVPSEGSQSGPKRSDSTGNDHVAPRPDAQMGTPTRQDEVTVIPAPTVSQSCDTGALGDMSGHPQSAAVPATLSEAPEESSLPVAPTIGQQVEVGNAQDAEAEFELDSSPIESSPEDSSDSLSDDSSDNDYEMLDPAEQARLLMQEDGGSDDEGGTKGAASAPLRTLNEKPDEVVEKPNIIVTEDMPIEELGEAEAIVENLVLIKAKTTGEYQVLETGSLLCLKDRTVIGVVAETLGRVQQPLYTIRFTNVAAISEAGISKNTAVYYVPQHSTFVFTQAIKAIKGSDASNIHDEEVGDDELEFSDDEAEAEFKRNQKLRRQAKRGGRGASANGYSGGPRENGFSSGNRNGNAERSQVDTASISYDDDVGGDGGLYTPLARPSNLHERPGQGARGEISSGSRHHDRGGHDSRGRGGHSIGRGDRGRGDRGRGDRGRGDRGRGRDRGDRHRGSNSERGDRQGSVNSDHPRPPVPVPNLSLPPAPPPPRPPYSMGPPKPPAPRSFTPAYPQYLSQQTSNYQPYSPGYPSGHPPHPYHQGQSPSQLPQPGNLQPPRQQYGHQSHYSQQQNHAVNPSISSQPPPSNPAPPLPPGSFVNPAFFANNYQQPPRQPQYPPQYGSFLSPQQNGYLGGQR